MRGMIKVAPFGHASTSRSVEEAALDPEWPGKPDKDYTQTSILEFARRPQKSKRKRRTKNNSGVEKTRCTPPPKFLPLPRCPPEDRKARRKHR